MEERFGCLRVWVYLELPGAPKHLPGAPKPRLVRRTLYTAHGVTREYAEALSKGFMILNVCQDRISEDVVHAEWRANPEIIGK